MRRLIGLLLCTIICAGCRPVTPVVVFDRDYDFRGFPHAAVAAQADSEVSLSVRDQARNALARLEYDDLGLLISESEEEAILDAKRLSLVALFIVDARRFRKGGGEDGEAPILPPTGEGREGQRHDDPSGSGGVTRWTFNVGIKLVEVKSGRIVYDVRYGYHSESPYLDVDLCLKKILAPLAIKRERGNWKDYLKEDIR